MSRPPLRNLLLAFTLSVFAPATGSVWAAPAGWLFFDEFDRGIPGWTAVQPPGNYSAGPLRWQFDVVNSAFVEQSNIYTDASAASTTATAPMLINDTVAPQNFTYRARLTAGDDDGFGLIFGYQDETNFFRVTFARQSRTGYPWRGWSVDRKIDGTTVNLFGAGTPGHVVTFVNAANRPFDVTISVTGDNRLSLTVVDNPEAAATEYQLVQNQPLPASVAGRVGLMTWGMSGANPRGFRIGNLQLEPVALSGNPNALSNWTPVVPPNAPGSQTLTGGNGGKPIWSLALGKDGPLGTLHENSDAFASASNVNGNTNIDFIAPSLVITNNVTWSNYVVSARIIPDDDDGHGLLLRYQDETSFYRIALASEATATGRPPRGLSIQKNVNGQWSEIFRESTVKYNPLPGIPYHLAAAIEGNQLEILLSSDNDGNGAFFQYGPFEITGPTVDHGKVGVFSWGMTRTEFDHVRVSEGVPLGALRFSSIRNSGGQVEFEIVNNTAWYFDVQTAASVAGPWQTAALKVNQPTWTSPVSASESFWRLKQSSLTNEPPPFDPGSWTLAILPDTQNYSQSYPHIFESQTSWIAENRDAYNIVYVLHLGDIVNNNGTNQWENARRAMTILDGVVPYALAPGNHDYGSGGAQNRQTWLNEYFPLTNYVSWPTFGGAREENKMESTYHLFNAGGRDWLILALEWGPRDGAVAWANDIVMLYPNRSVIMITHAHLYFDDTRYDWFTKERSQSWNPYSYPTANDPDGTNDGEDLWQKLVKLYPNFLFTFNGHVLGDGQGRLTSAGDHGNLVHQMLINFQMKPMGGEGWMRLLHFLPDGRTVQATTYSPFLDQYKTDSENQFLFTLDAPLP